MPSKKNNFALFGGLGLLLLFLLSKKTKAAPPFVENGIPRSLRNNNPGNILINPANNWKGKIPIDQNTDGEYEQFESLPYGARAMIILLRNYINSGNDTIEKVINRWAPPPGNPTAEYIDFVSSITGIPSGQKIVLLGRSTDKIILKKLVQSMADFEAGTNNAVPDSIFNQAWEML